MSISNREMEIKLGPSVKSSFFPVPPHRIAGSVGLCT